MKDKIISIFKENGELSSMRVAFMISVILSNFIIFGLWLGLSIKNNMLMPVPESILVLFALANSINICGKVGQKFLEKKEINK